MQPAAGPGPPARSPDQQQRPDWPPRSRRKAPGSQPPRNRPPPPLTLPPAPLACLCPRRRRPSPSASPRSPLPSTWIARRRRRERGVTISCTTKEFFTDNFHYTIIDAPGAPRLWLLWPAKAAGLPSGAAGMSNSKQHSSTVAVVCAAVASTAPARRRCRHSARSPTPSTLPLCPAPGHRDFIKNMISGCRPGRRVPAHGARRR